MRVLVYGDSNTFGVLPMSSLGDHPVCRPGERWAEVMAEGLPEHEVIVSGLPGRTTVHSDPVEGEWLNGLTVLPAVIGTHRPVDVLVLMLGTNDLKLRLHCGAAEIAEGTRRLLRAAAMTGYVGRCFVVAPPAPKAAGIFAEMFRGAEDRAAGMAEAVAAVADEEGAGFFDAGSVIEVQPGEGVHFGVRAHRVLGEAMRQALRGWP